MKKILLALVSLTMVIGVLGCDLFEVEIKVKFNEQVKAIHATPGTNETAYKIDDVSSSDTSVVTASISGDVVTLTSKGKGTATVTFYSSEYAKKAACTVNVSETGDMTGNWGSLIYYTYDKTTSAATTYSIWEDNPASQIDIVEGYYSKQSDNAYKLYVKGNIIYSIYDGKWVRGVGIKGTGNYFTTINWKTKGQTSGSLPSITFYKESSYNSESGYYIPTELKSSTVNYSQNSTSKDLTLGGTVYNKN